MFQLQQNASPQVCTSHTRHEPSFYSSLSSWRIQTFFLPPFPLPAVGELPQTWTSSFSVKSRPLCTKKWEHLPDISGFASPHPTSTKYFAQGIFNRRCTNCPDRGPKCRTPHPGGRHAHAPEQGEMAECSLVISPLTRYVFLSPKYKRCYMKYTSHYKPTSPCGQSKCPPLT